MSVTQITIPRSFAGAIQGIVNDAQRAAVQELAAKFGFDPAEGMALIESKEMKLVQKRGPAAKKSKEKEAKPKTKRGPTGYLLFSTANRGEVQLDLSLDLEDGEKLKPQAVVKELAVRWGALEEEERLEWKIRADELKLEAEE